jgi:hypothetical protein
MISERFRSLNGELSRIRQEFEIKHRRKPTAEEIRILQLAEQLYSSDKRGARASNAIPVECEHNAGH